MAVFRMKSDFTFEAKNLEDAFIKVSQHLCDIRRGLSTKLTVTGYLDIEQVAKKKGKR